VIDHKLLHDVALRTVNVLDALHSIKNHGAGNTWDNSKVFSGIWISFKEGQPKAVTSLQEHVPDYNYYYYRIGCGGGGGVRRRP
jgi:hypothetical protein